MWILYFIPDYTRWHYTQGFRDLLANCRNIIRFVANFFSIKTLLHTLFSPWRRLSEPYKRGFEPSDFFGTLLVNTLMRLVGFVLRSVTIALALLALLFVTISSFFILVAWAAGPLLIFFLFSLGLSNLFPS